MLLFVVALSADVEIESIDFAEDVASTAIRTRYTPFHFHAFYYAATEEHWMISMEPFYDF